LARFSSLFVASVVAALVASWCPSAWAQQGKKRTSTLGWDRLPGADACVATQPLARAVEARLGRKVFVSPAEADVSVEGRVEKRAQGFAATIVLRDADGKLLGTRTLEKNDPTCAALTEPLVLVIAVMIDPDAAMGAPPPAPPPEPPPPPPEPRVEKIYVPVPVPAPAPVKEKPQKPLLVVDAALSGRVAIGSVPDVGLGLSAVGVLVPRGFIGFAGRAAFVLPSKAPAREAEVGFMHGTLGGGLCPLAHTFGRVLLTACAEGEIGVLLVRPSGLPRTVNEARFTLAGGGSFGASVLVAGPVTLRAGLMAMVPLLRETFVYTEPSGQTAELFRQLPVTFAGDLGVGVRFP